MMCSSRSIDRSDSPSYLARFYLRDFTKWKVTWLSKKYLENTRLPYHVQGQENALEYRASVKSLYNFDNLSRRQLKRYLPRICSTYSVVISRFFITLHFGHPPTMMTSKTLLNEPLAKWLLLERKHSARIGYPKISRFSKKNRDSWKSWYSATRINNIVKARAFNCIGRWQQI